MTHHHHHHHHRPFSQACTGCDRVGISLYTFADADFANSQYTNVSRGVSNIQEPLCTVTITISFDIAITITITIIFYQCLLSVAFVVVTSLLLQLGHDAARVLLKPSFVQILREAEVMGLTKIQSRYNCDGDGDGVNDNVSLDDHPSTTSLSPASQNYLRNPLVRDDVMEKDEVLQKV